MDIPYGYYGRWDGDGDPHTLKGDDIRVAARIFAAVVVSDALNFDRPYRASRPEAEVRTCLRGNTGVPFDPAVADRILSLEWRGEALLGGPVPPRAWPAGR